MEFTDHLEDKEVPALANTSHDSDSERPTKVDRNCEVCKLTKKTRAPCRKRTGEAVPQSEKSVSG